MAKSRNIVLEPKNCSVRRKKRYTMIIQTCYKSDACKKYREWNRKPWKLFEAWSGQKLKWYQKIECYIECRILDIPAYFTNPYKIINHKCKKYIKRK
jgi:hypothetical protein